MFTSRAEYRLLLRQDNADLRLSEIGHSIGLLPLDDYHQFKTKKDQIEMELARLRNTRSGSTSLDQLLRRPEVHYADLPSRDEGLSAEIRAGIETTVKYAGYVERQNYDVQKSLAIETKQIPDWLNYDSVTGLRTEARLKLKEIRPSTIGQASRISGVTPADLALLSVWMKRPPGIRQSSNGNLQARQDHKSQISSFGSNPGDSEGEAGAGF